MAISKELTQKVKRTDSDEDDEEDEENVRDIYKEDEEDEELLKNKEDNIKTESEVDDFIKLCRKYYDKKQTIKKVEKDGISSEIISEKEKEISCDERNNTQANRSDMKSELCSNEKSNTSQVSANDTESKLHNEKSSTSHTNTNDTKSKPCNNEKSSNLLANTNDVKNKICKRKKKKEDFTSDVDCVTSKHNSKKLKSQDVNERSDLKKSKKEKSKLNLKVQEVKKKCKANNKQKKQEKENKDYSPNLEFENPKQKPILDTPLEETTSGENVEKGSNLSTNLKTVTSDTLQEPSISHEVEIDPKKYVNIKPKHLKTQLPDLTTGEDEGSEQEEETHKIMSEAFADDDVVEEFRKEKEEEVISILNINHTSIVKR